MPRTAVLLACCIAVAAGRADPPAAAESPTVVKADPLPAWDAKFRRTDGWVGADGAYSVVLPDRCALWLFSDTWVGTVRDGKRRNVAMANNTVGVQDGRGDEAKLSFAVKKSAAGKPEAIFVPPDGRGWFWLYAGVAANDKLYVFLPRQEKANAATGAFGFKHTDTWLGTVENPGADPTAWKVAYAKLPFVAPAGRKREWGSAALRVADDAYVYGFDEGTGKPRGSRRMVVARAPAKSLANFATWRFWNGKAWAADATAATPLADGLATEYSVSLVPSLKRYAAVYTDGGLSDKIVARFAPAPEGPWSAPVLLYRCPEMARDKKVFTYAAKAHPHLGGDNELVVSYCVNAYDLAPVLNDASLYWPTFVRVTLR